MAALTRRLGADRLSLLENAAQEAAVRALERWPREGVPTDPNAWLLRVAHNVAVDALRAERRLVALGTEPNGVVDPPEPQIDDELQLMFLCCHPVLPRAAQIALTLKIASGFTSAQIARAFVSDERTIEQRIVRAKQRLRDEAVTLGLPDPPAYAARVVSVLDVLYLVFNEGHAMPSGDAAIDDGLCDDALRLVRILCDIDDEAPTAAHALRALFCFQASRVPARRADDGSLLLLHEQDRTRWRAPLIEEGLVSLGRAARGRELTRFHLEAGIAASHATARSHVDTDWRQIVGLYDQLRACAPSPIVEVNRALAVAMSAGAIAGLDELDAIPERSLLARYPYALAAYAELHASLGHLDAALSYLDRALAEQTAPAQRKLLLRKRAAISR
ncbi:MAG: polymerase sigma factor, sigma-70 family [Myxococcales bacterium]|nr:polymerase sigma factor, sigma-70 family [Myxococcales bacterium]